ncbi:hypothetical protein DICVIV_04471 [Dictyocaulus viviparus]|uniref:Uncharacterized protein n=1 Tax=Dictyocaulus viviparus TaxID=29172 RepID=A0A0D8XXL1_DICVI|nr:hypothetical protein DICVIV_04471 [Dictyocaulus viviparus]
MNGNQSESPSSTRSKDMLSVIKIESPGSESPRSMRDSHKGSGNLRGGGLQKVYVSTKPDMKRYKSKLDRRLGVCIFGCFATIACILMIYGIMHKNVNDELSVYVNRTHQIAKELKFAMDENYPKDNQSVVDQYGKHWMTVEELEYDSYLIRETNATIWFLFWWNFLLALLLVPILLAVHCDMVEGNLVKLVYRGILVCCLLFCLAQLLYLIHPLLWGASMFPAQKKLIAFRFADASAQSGEMIDRLFLQAYPRDEYQLNNLKDRFACEFEPHEVLVQFDLQYGDGATLLCDPHTSVP